MENVVPKDIFVVVPAYGESEVLATTVAPLLKEGFSVVVVDDGSCDRTADVLRKLPVYRLRHPVNLGQGAALQTGMTFALSRGAAVIVHFDADGQHRLKDLRSLLQPVLAGDADVALGSRFLRAADKKFIPVSRRILLKGAVIVNGFLTGLWLTDAHNGLRVLSRKAAGRIRLEENGFAHATEIIHQIRRLKLSYVERPARVRYTRYSRRKGQSFWNALNIVIDLLLRRIFR